MTCYQLKQNLVKLKLNVKHLHSVNKTNLKLMILNGGS